MQLLTGFIIVLACISFGKCQFVRTYPRSAFENVGLGEAPRGVYIPQDSFLNALRNPSYRAPVSPINYGYNVPQQPFSVQAAPATTTTQHNALPTSTDMQEMEPNNEDRGPRRRKIHRRRRIFNEQIGSPQIYSPSEFQNIPLGEVPAGVYIPPDSLLNALRTSRSRVSYQGPEMRSNVNGNFGLTGNQGPVNEQRQQMNPVLQSAAPSIQYVAPSADLDDGDYGRRQPSPSRRQQQTQGRRMPSVRPPSLVLDPSMEYPADKPREEMQSLPRTVEEYYDLEGNKMQDSSATRQQRRKPSQRRRTQTRAKPDYIEPVYPPRTYSPSVFQNIGFGEAPPGVHIPSDSLLNTLRDQSPRRQTPRAYEPQESYDTRASEDRTEAREEHMQEVAPQHNAQARRNASRQRSRQSQPSDVTENREYGSRSRQQEPVLSFRESSQQRQRSHRRNADN
ncbi:CREB-binding protein [Parasteatoda tepidariorum]|uniref:CREB-binding protein n=1 Tax=Parasteatoda tepidariorum TaxID=114398 RepID=UPI00077FC423|nr:uncharacterized protein LOC107451673 [Parasteatoda tepidariorum]